MIAIRSIALLVAATFPLGAFAQDNLGLDLEPQPQRITDLMNEALRSGNWSADPRVAAFRDMQVMRHARELSNGDDEMHVAFDARMYARMTGKTMDEVNAQFGFTESDYGVGERSIMRFNGQSRTPAESDGNRRRWEVTVGSPVCDVVRIEDPHAGLIRSVSLTHKVAKAKARYRCHIVGTGWGPLPSDVHVTWTARLWLHRRGWLGFSDVAFQSYRKVGKSVHFRNNRGRYSGTQVWFDYCDEDHYPSRLVH